MERHFPETPLFTQAADFTRSLKLPPLDGVVMANSLHFHRHKERALSRVRGLIEIRRAAAAG